MTENLSNNTLWFRGAGLSMEPLLSPGSVVRLARCPAEEINPGDIVVYCGNGTHVCHRVVLREKRRDQLWFYLQGNDPLRADGWIPEYRVLGKIIEVDGAPLSRWKCSLFYWHGLFEVMVLYKILRLPFFRRFQKYHPMKEWFARGSALVHPTLAKVRGRAEA